MLKVEYQGAVVTCDTVDEAVAFVKAFEGYTVATGKDGWVEHDGSGMPVPGDTRLIVRFRDGVEEEEHQSSRAEFWYDDELNGNAWVWDNRESDIIAYRVVN